VSIRRRDEVRLRLRRAAAAIREAEIRLGVYGTGVSVESEIVRALSELTEAEYLNAMAQGGS
jgi:hypothetical protein